MLSDGIPPVFRAECNFLHKTGHDENTSRHEFVSPPKLEMRGFRALGKEKKLHFLWKEERRKHLARFSHEVAKLEAKTGSYLGRKECKRKAFLKFYILSYR